MGDPKSTIRSIGRVPNFAKVAVYMQLLCTSSVWRVSFMSGHFKYTAPAKLRKAILTLAFGWREERGTLTDAKSSYDPALDPIIVASAERPGDGFEWRPA